MTDDIRQWLRDIAEDEPEGAYEGHDIYMVRAARRTLAELDRLHAEVTELGNKYVHEVQRAAHGETTTEWGVRWVGAPEDEQIEPRDSYQSASAVVKMFGTATATLVSRQVTRGPWTEATA